MKQAIILLFLIVASGASCDSPEFHDGYQFGDLTRIAARDINILIDARERACAYKDEDDMRAALHRAALVLIRVYQPGYPPGGICDERFDNLITNLRALQEEK